MLSFRFVHFPWPRRWLISFGTRPQDCGEGYPPGTLWHDWLLIGWRLCHSAHFKREDGRADMRCWLVDETGPVEWVDGVTDQWAAIKANWKTT